MVEAGKRGRLYVRFDGNDRGVPNERPGSIPALFVLPQFPYPHLQVLVPQQHPVSQQPLVQPQFESFMVPPLQGSALHHKGTPCARSTRAVGCRLFVPLNRTLSYLRLLVLPRTKAASTPRGPSVAKSALGTLAIRRAVLAR
jgi:hypothetical protein